MKLVTLVFAVSLVLGCRSQETRETYDPAVLEEILEGMRKREASIKDVRCEFSVWSLNPTENTVRGEVSWAYKEGKEYRDESNFYERDGKLAWRAIDSFDEEKRYRYDPKKKVGLIGRHDHHTFSGSFTPRTLLCWDLDRSVIGFQDVAGYIASSKIVDMEEKTVGSDRIYVISGEHKGAPVYEIWIHADKDYRIEKFIQYHGPDRRRYHVKVEDIKLEEYKGIWFPVEGAKQFGFDDSGKPEFLLRLKVKPGTLKVNEGIPDGLFTVEFSKDTRVLDEFAIAKKRARFTGKPAPPLHIVEWFGSKPLTLEQLRGKVVWLEFWSSDCGACRGDHYWSLLARLDKELGPKGLVIIAVHPSGASKESVEQFLRQKAVEYIVALDEEEDEGPGKTFTAYNAEGWPESHVIDKKGVRRGIGVPLTTDISELEPLAKKLLEEDS